MKTKHKKLIMLAVLAGCATQAPKVKDVLTEANQPTVPSGTPTISTSPATASPSASATLPSVAVTVIKRKTPALNLPDANKKTLTAAEYFRTYANNDEFYAYLRGYTSTLEGGNESNLETAITKFRECLDTHEPITITWKNYSILYRKTVQGGWNGQVINMNAYIPMDDIETAGFWIHEIGHACGFTHISNSLKLYPIIRKSFPYQAGYAFEDFITEKVKPKLAGE